MENRLGMTERATLVTHLGDCEACGELVASATKTWFRAQGAGRRERRADFAPAQQVGPYTIVTLAGRGGMGEVYRAHDSRIGRDVAIKTLPARFSDDSERLSRFRTEVRATGKITHPHTVTVFEVGTHEGIPYFVTEWLTGTTLQERLARGPLPVAQVCRMGAQLARALAAAHDKGVIHRDLKPDNIFVCADGSTKILDFGVARLVAAFEDASLGTLSGGVRGGVEGGSATEPGMLVGTVGYMSPEQIRGEEIDARADIFSLGAVLYEMATGRKPFEGKGAVELLSATLHDEPAALDGELGAIIARCLAKAPSDRFQSAHDLAFHLDALGTRTGAPRRDAS
ncbi:MAG TPA: serine/threonine-protein kinase, partial [Polyangiaceae bacterium]|nr:serine/threonine-protein kinase [Polyangiaceae bacterium]